MRQRAKSLIPFLVLALAFGLAPLRCRGATNAPVFHASLRLALEAAAESDSLTLVVFHSQGSAASKKLLTQTIRSQEFAAQAGDVQVVELDVDLSPTTAREFRVREVPAAVLLSPNAKVLSRRTGYFATAELMLWLRTARDQLRSGKWNGLESGEEAAAFADRASADRLSTNDIAALLVLLGHSDPAERETASTLLAARREAAVPDLINALTNQYLGVRIGACETLARLAPAQAGEVDPWLAPSEILPAVHELHKWWAQTGVLPQVSPVSITNGPNQQTLAAYVRELRSNDPDSRTRAMSRLVALGHPALPGIRAEIIRAEKSGDERTLSLLEEVRWAILVPAEVERVAQVRVALAKAKGTERQAAAVRLARMGNEAIPALAELASDSDALVVESALRALSGIGGEKSVPAMAALMKAGDDNLRMTAAQALGKSRSSAAIPALLPALADANETVACTALSALEQIYSTGGYSPRSKARPPEVEQAIARCLEDPRWRVRSAAAELCGKLRSSPQTAALRKLLEDSDGFVVRNALEALKQIGAAPEPAQLMTVAGAHPDLRGQVLELLTKTGSDEAVQAGTEMYSAGNTEARLALLLSMARAASEQRSLRGEAWMPLLKQAVSDSEPRLRRAAAEVISALSPELAVTMTDTLLSDADPEVRTRGAMSVMAIISGGRIMSGVSQDTRFADIMAELDSEDSLGFSGKKDAKTNTVVATQERVTKWHQILAGMKEPAKPAVVAATFVTGGTNADASALETTLRTAEKKDLECLAQPAVMAALMPLLSDSRATPVLQVFRENPALALQALKHSHRLTTPANSVLLEPGAFLRMADKASPDEVAAALNYLLEERGSGFSLLNNSSGWEPIAEAMFKSTNSAWRAAAIHVMGIQKRLEMLPAVTSALEDANAWVRAAAVVSFARLSKDRASTETRLGPMILDPDTRVARKAAVALLEPETREAAGLNGYEGRFEYENIHIWSPSSVSPDQRPLTLLSSKPAYLEHARKRLAESSVEDAALLGLLLAQHGDFGGLERLASSPVPPDSQDDGVQETIAAMIALSKDSKYVPYLKSMLASAKNEQEMRVILQALRGMTGAEARELRLEVNRKIRQQQ
jgi:HEAT repeat protein